MNIVLPTCPPKARLLLWADLSYSDAEEITKIKSIPEISRILCQVLHIEAPDPQRGILLELYTNMVLFCKQQKYSKEQTSVLLSIIKNVHQLNTDVGKLQTVLDSCLPRLDVNSPAVQQFLFGHYCERWIIHNSGETPLNNMDQCFTYFSELLLCHSVRRPPFTIDLFNSEQVTEIMKYFMNTYMRHYMLYKYVFTPQMYLDLSLSYVGMPEELPPEQLETSEAEKDIEIETETEAGEASEQDTASTKILLTETAAPKQDLSPKGALRTIVQKEVKEEMTRLTAHLEKCLEESTDQLNTALTALETRLQRKK